MLTLLLVLLVAGLGLAVFFYVGAMFFQGYIYTEPSEDLYWQAPAAAGVLTVFFALWCILIASSEGASPRDIPYDTLFRFSARVDLFEKPAPEILVVTKAGEKKTYKLKAEPSGIGMSRYRYFDPDSGRFLRNDDIESIEIKNNDEVLTFKRVPAADNASYGEFVSDQGWSMKEYEEGPTGNPSVFRSGRFVLTLFLNFLHFLLWWLVLWLLLRFQWGHALGLGIVLWLVFTLSILPMLLNYAAETAQERAIGANKVAALAPTRRVSEGSLAHASG